MLSVNPGIKVWVASQATDMRKGCFSLAAMVQQEFNLEPRSSNLFVFFSKGGKKVKLLYWDRNGFVLTYKSLSTGRFRVPQVGGTKYKISISDLTLLLEGIDLTHHQRLKAV